MDESKETLDDLAEDERTPPLSRRAGYWLWDLLKTWGPALLAVFVIRSVVAEPFRIPSGSMIPTLEIGDFILVNKFAYGLRFPFTALMLLPVGEPQRGDVIVFRYPEDPSLDYIKRIVGVPGDEVMVRGNVLHVNGIPVEKRFVSLFSFQDDACVPESARLYDERLDSVQHAILNTNDPAFALAEFGPTVVPPDTVFVMGDNRDNSSDSRRWGPVPRTYIKGRAMVVWFSYDACKGGHLGPLDVTSLRLGRFGTVIH
ncbi:MAG: signal peptidase I [Deltaproteobacteria bacterium]|nr:signal peptidase I [Deltaproteobacteria bacterium]